MNQDNLIKKESEILKIILNYLNKIENNNSILKGNMLKDEEKEFILNDFNAFIIGLVSDQSVKAEIAWSLPYKLAHRLGTFDFKKILIEYDVDKIEKLIKNKPALHRYPNKMAIYIFEAIKNIVENYDSNAENIWNGKTAKEIVKNLEKFKGIGHKKASLGSLILIRDLSVNISDKENIDIAYDIHIRRLFLRLGLVEEDVQEKVLESARKLYPEFPGKLTTAFWTLGREFCRPTNPLCSLCPLHEVCESDFERLSNIK